MFADLKSVTNRDLLRGKTASLHKKVDWKLSKILNADDDGYFKMLKMHALIIPAAENFIIKNNYLNTLPQRDERWRSAAVLSDLGLAGTVMPNPTNMSFLNAASYGAGVMYVLEGSRLGGQMILKQFASHADAGLPVSFLNHGNELRLWKSFTTWLDAQEWSAVEADLAVRGACEIFQAYLAIDDDLGVTQLELEDQI